MAVKVPWGLGAFFALCCALNLSIGVQSHSWGRFPNPHAITEQHTPSLEVATQCPTLRIAVINSVNFHFEVLASVLTVLQHFAPYTDVYLNKFVQSENFNGAFDIVHWFPGTFKKAVPSSVDRQYDMVFLISYDYEMQDNIELVTLMKPTVLVAYIHNAQLGLKKLLALAPQVKLLTLSPHVAKSLQQYSNRSAEWMLPVYNMDVHEDCLTFPQRWVMGLCLRGFALQGKFSNLRRNYSSIWRQMTDKLTTIRDPQIGKVFHVNVLGKGEDRLALPTWLESHVNVYKRLMYQQFFNTIAHNVALIPSLANPRYYTEKFSSTVLTSFITGTPVLAHEQLLTAYSFLTPDVVYLQQPGEEEMDAMLRLATMTPDEIIKVRLSLLKLRDHMNARSGRMMEEIVAEACEANRKKAAAQAA